jgi:hypothetical protein
MFDVVFISYDEPTADQNFDRLQCLCSGAQRVHGVTGIANAYQQALAQTQSSHIFTVDGDNWVHENFRWNNVPNFEGKEDHVHVWRSLNPVNGLIYGNGGIKLFPRKSLEAFDGNYQDFTSTVAAGKYYVQNTLASTTKFNTSPFTSWRTGFREAVKLSAELIKGQDPKTESRLRTWTSVGADTDNGIWTILGARMGVIFSLENNDHKKDFYQTINDFDVLTKLFKEVSSMNPHSLVLAKGARLSELSYETVLFDSKQSQFVKENIIGKI